MTPELTYFVVQDLYEPSSGPLDTLAGALALATFKLTEREEEHALLIIGLESREWRTDVPSHFLFRIEPLREWKAMAE